MNNTFSSQNVQPIETLPFGPKAHSQEIDSLRGIAAFLVFLFHSDGIINTLPEKLSGSADLLQAFIVTGATGVTFFFILSGFLLSIPFFMNPKPDTLAFYKKRLIRIIPIFWLIVTIAGITTGVIPNDPIKAARSYLFAFNGWEMFPYSVPWWTLRTEMQFYIILPLLMQLVYLRKGRIILIVLFPLYLIIFFTGLKFSKQSINIYFYYMQSVIRHAPEFMIGILLAWIYTNYGSIIKSWCKNNKIFSNGLSDSIIIFAFILLSIVLREVSLHGGTFKAEVVWPQRFVYESIPWSIILMSLLLLPIRLKPLLSNKFLAKYGEISYPFYLVHAPVIFYISSYLSILKKGWNLFSIGCIAISFIISFLIAYILNKFIEKPIIKFKNNIH